MVEGHSVHRVAAAHTQRLVGKAFVASSPNGRCVDGAAVVSGLPLRRVEAYGKNLFYFFGGGNTGKPEHVMHVHFGMSGAFKIFDLDSVSAPEPTSTTRLRLEHPASNIGGHLSAMTVGFGGAELYAEKASKLGEDPLRSDADPERLWQKVSTSSKGIGLLLMDQSFFPGVGNIYRAEILFKANVHPEIRGKDLTRVQFEHVWHHSVSLLRRGFECGSILTVDPEEAVTLGKPDLRRYIYNTRNCPRCATAIQSWQVAGRTCYCCPSCQRFSTPDSSATADAPITWKAEPPRLFESHCVSESYETRLASPEKLKVSELRAELRHLGMATSGKKAELVERFKAGVSKTEPSTSMTPVTIAGRGDVTEIKSYSAAAAEKAAANEGKNVEHVADLDLTLAGQTVDWLDLEGDRGTGRGRKHKSDPNVTPKPSRVNLPGRPGKRFKGDAAERAPRRSTARRKLSVKA